MRPLCLATVLGTALLTSASSTVSGAETLTTETAAAMARDIAKRVERIRGARFDRPVSVKVVSDATARAHFHARLLKFWPEDQVRHDQRVYQQLGMLPAGTDLMKTLLDVLEEQAGAYYDPDSDTFYVLSDAPRSTAPILMAHELTHALDDQRFSIDATLNRIKDDDDRATAYSAVVEGSGTIVMSLFLMEEMQAGHIGPQAIADLQKSEAGQAARLLAAAPILQRSLLGPYQLGQSFLLRGDPQQFASFRPGDLDRAFASPPVSTEQLIHPEKYWDHARRDLPRSVMLPDLAASIGPIWKQVASGTLGELVLAVMAGLGGVDLGSTASALPANWTNRAASGWAGDLYQHYTDGQRAITIQVAAWDTAEDAAEFTTALKPLPGRSAFRRQDTTVVVAGDLTSTPEALAETVFAALASKRAGPLQKAKP